MLSEELAQLVRSVLERKCEMQNVELKKAQKGTPERLYDTLSSFSNQPGGGILIFGVDEKAGYVLSGVYDAQDLQTQITNQARQMQPIVRPVFTVAQIDGKTIVSAEISECDVYEKPCFYTGAGRLRGSYIRVGETDQPMTEYEIYSYEVFKRKIQDELRTVERAGMQDFSEVSLNEYYIKLRQAKPNLARQSNERILELQGLADHGKPTVAGIMLFGEFPQAYFPQLSITAMMVAGAQFGELGPHGERFIDNVRLEGTIPQMLEDALAFVRRNIRNATIVDENGVRRDRSEYPIKAIREIILNALIHRDYSIHTDSSPIRIILFDDRLEVENPGGLYGRLTIDDLGKVAGDTRNPFIAGALEVLIDTENRFSGIPTIRDEMQRAGLPPAVFESKRGFFRVTLFNNRQVQAGGFAVKGRDAIQDSILRFCTTPRTKDEIAQHLGMDSAYYVVRKYIKPLISSGCLELSIPDAPRSKKQKYRAVAQR